MKKKIIKEILFWTISVGLIVIIGHFMPDNILKKIAECIGYFVIGFGIGKAVRYALKEISKKDE